MIKLFVFVAVSFFSDKVPYDSLGTETINGQTFIIHRVEEKETLFAISRRYGSTVDQIARNNTIPATGLEIGQILKIPYTPKPARSADVVTHTVAQKETLFSISKLYNVPVDDLKKWNNLTGISLDIGQQLIVRKKSGTSTAVSVVQSGNVKNAEGVHTVSQKETMYSIARQYGISVDELKTWNNLEANELKIGQTLVVRRPSNSSSPVRQQNPANAATTISTPVKEVQRPPVAQNSEAQKNTGAVKNEPREQTIRISETVKNGDEVIETGVAELIEGTEGNRKYLALHRSAPVGTILKVRNEMNNREVFVRVMGKLPDTALTDKLVIRVSKSAYDRLGAIDQRFRVEVTYYK
jgi:LysM repeat protein